jgi:hypothetical protein
MKSVREADADAGLRAEGGGGMGRGGGDDGMEIVQSRKHAWES